jgi:surface protein
MFSSCSNLTELDLSNFNTSNVTLLNSMFSYCSNLTELNLSSFDTSSVTNMSSMFGSCTNLTELDLSNFNTSNVINMSSMFSYCENLTELDLSNFDMSNVTYINGAFQRCRNLKNLKFGKNLGKAYTQQTENYSNYAIIVSENQQLTHDSLMSIINGLYDLNLTYDVANGGTLYRQKLQLYTSLKKLLTAEEIAIAENKGWNVT